MCNNIPHSDYPDKLLSPDSPFFLSLEIRVGPEFPIRSLHYLADALEFTCILVLLLAICLDKTEQR